MSDIDQQGLHLLSVLVRRLPQVVPSNPRTFITYKQAHDELGLKYRGPTYGESLKAQGLASLAEWTATEGFPGITGLIIDGSSLMPGEGYFKLFNKTNEDFPWWIKQISESKEFNWRLYLPDYVPPIPPKATDVAEPPSRIETTVYRIIRDTKVSRRVKTLHNFKCQICGETIELPDGARYAEAHHIRPLGNPHSGPDSEDNVLCLCPNHHAEMDYGVRQLDLTKLRKAAGHSVGDDYLRYHNEKIFGQ